MLEVDAPAKINLCLTIKGKRPDGFHELETLITPTGLHDTLSFKKSDSSFAFTCSRRDLESEDNLVTRAVRILERHVQRSLPVRIHLEKRIPSGAGLGGGSSDAAATLKALRQLFELECSNETLEQLGAELGSDIPCFIRGGTTWCRGRGERLESVEFPWKLHILLLRHALEIATPWAYKNWADSKEIPGLPYVPQATPWGHVVNDLERPAFQKYLILGETKRWLLEQPEVEAAAMTGSGSALFALLRDGTAATRAQLSERARHRYGDSLWTA